MTTQQMQEVFIYDKDLLTQDDAIELLADMFDERYEITPAKVRRFFGIKNSQED